MYAAIDVLADKLDRQVLKHKELLKDHRCDSDAIERAAVGTAPKAAASDACSRVRIIGGAIPAGNHSWPSRARRAGPARVTTRRFAFER